jgi:asparagine synthase (glutamine-hydrolysing)
MNDSYVERVVDLTDPQANRIRNMTVEEARTRVAEGSAEDVRAIDGSFALVGRVGRRVRLARSLDRPLRYFLAKQAAGPALFVSDRIDTIRERLRAEGLASQFHPTYTRMVPAHHVVEIALVGCPDPEASATRFFAPSAPPLPADPEAVGRAYVGALAEEIAAYLEALPREEPIGVCFSGGIDSGAVFLLTYDLVLRRGLNPGRLKAFTLSLGRSGADLAQAREFLTRLGLEMFLEPIEADPATVDPHEAVRVIEDYKPLDVESAAMALTLLRGIRERYPAWRHLLDGDGGDENLKDYPIEENPELTIRSVLHNAMLYQEGWGVGKMKHSATYSGGHSRSYSRTWAPLRRYGFEGFSPYTRARVIEAAEAIPFVALTGYDHQRLYSLKGEIVARGIAALTGRRLPVFPKRRFQDGGLPPGSPRPFRADESAYRSHFLSLYV